MSGTANEFENPGGNYPDRKDAAGPQPDAAEQRGDAGVGGAVHEETGGAGDAEAVQDEPVLEQNQATIPEKLDGIAAQTRVDLGDESHDRYEEVLRQRLSDSDIQLTDDDVSSLARRSAAGGADGEGV